MEERTAGFWIRVLAVLLDGAILIAIAYVLSFIFQDPPGDIVNSTSADIFSYIYAIVFVIILTATHFRGSPGKMIAGIQVVTMEGKTIGLLRSTIRYFAAVLSYIILFIGVIMVAITKEHTGLHDLLCKTRVVYKKG